MKKALIFSVILSFLFIGNVYAQWHSFTSENPTKPQINVLFSDETQTVFEVTLPGYFSQTTKIGEEECVQFILPSVRQLNEKGAPALPAIAELFMINDEGAPRFEITTMETEEVDCAMRVAPAKGHVTRNVSWDSVPYTFGKVYQENDWYPKNVMFVQDPFIFRTIRGVRWQMSPIRYNPVTQKIQIVKKVTVKLLYDQMSTVNIKTRGEDAQRTKEFEEFNNNMFANYATRQSREASFPAEAGKLCIITHADFMNAANMLKALRSDRDPVVISLSDLGDGSATAVANKIKELYGTYSFFVLFGDSDKMPTLIGKNEGALSDPCYVKLAGNDNYPDAFISRISAKTNTEAENQIKKIQEYETASATDWLNKALNLAGSDVGGSPSYADYVRAEYLRDGKTNTSTNLSIVQGGIESKYSFDYPTRCFYPTTTLDKTKIAAAINSGVSLINYINHGAETYWVTSNFNASDAAKLTNKGKYPIIFSVACVNGAYDYYSDCLAEAFLKKADGGAVAMFAATTNMSWVPPCDAQIASMNALLNGSYTTVGGIFFWGSSQCLKYWGAGDSDDGNQFFEQTHIFGDCSMKVRRP